MILATPARDAFQLVGSRVRVVSGADRIERTGTLSQTEDEDEAARLYAEQFSELYPRIADTVPCFAQLASCMDLLVVAALLQSSGAYVRVGWAASTFLDSGAFATHEGNVPRQVHSVVNYRWKSRSKVLTPVGGGVSINAAGILREHLQAREDGELAAARRSATPALGAADSATRWWWD
jgi:hypothetical protein